MKLRVNREPEEITKENKKPLDKICRAISGLSHKRLPSLRMQYLVDDFQELIQEDH